MGTDWIILEVHLIQANRWQLELFRGWFSAGRRGQSMNEPPVWNNMKLPRDEWAGEDLRYMYAKVV